MKHHGQQDGLTLCGVKVPNAEKTEIKVEVECVECRRIWRAMMEPETFFLESALLRLLEERALQLPAQTENEARYGISKQVLIGGGAMLHHGQPGGPTLCGVKVPDRDKTIVIRDIECSDCVRVWYGIEDIKQRIRKLCLGSTLFRSLESRGCHFLFKQKRGHVLEKPEVKWKITA